MNWSATSPITGSIPGVFNFQTAGRFSEVRTIRSNLVHAEKEPGIPRDQVWDQACGGRRTGESRPPQIYNCIGSRREQSASGNATDSDAPNLQGLKIPSCKGAPFVYLTTYTYM